MAIPCIWGLPQYLHMARCLAPIAGSAGPAGPQADRPCPDSPPAWDDVHVHVMYLLLQIWSGPFQILVVLLLLVRVIHLAPALAALGVTVLLIPATTLVAKVRGEGGGGG